MVPPYHLTKIFNLCKTNFGELKIILLWKEKIFDLFKIVWRDLKPNLNFKK